MICGVKMYYYVDQNGQQAGPVSEDLLKSRGVTASTLVWTEGMEGWTKASEVSELKHLFISVPPVPPPLTNNYGKPQDGYVQTSNGYAKTSNNYAQTGSMGQCPETYLVWSILATILCCLPLGIPAIVFSTQVERLWRQGDEAEARRKSEQAKIWCLIAAGAGLVFSIIYFFILLIAEM